jgi:putative tryptophan/tyrosine transport system substrate-binding protein
MPDPFTVANHQLIGALTARYPVPAIYNEPRIAESGGLIAYGTDFPELFRQAAEYIDRILKGVKPGDLRSRRRADRITGFWLRCALSALCQKRK